MLAGAPELAVVAVIDAALFWLDEDGGLFFGIEQPVAVCAAQSVPGRSGIDAETVDDALEIGTLPRARPGRYCAIANRERSIGNEEILGDIVHDAEAVTAWAGSRCRVGRERFGREVADSRRVASGPGIQHAKKVGEGSDGADTRSRAGRSAALLKGNGRRKARDVGDIGGADLIEQSPGIGGY